MVFARDVVALDAARWASRARRRPLRAADLVLHAAAWTDVDGAENDPQGAAAVNVGGTRPPPELGAPLVYFSTDYVFDGRRATPYVESDAPNPLSAYGRTKLHAEAAAGEDAWIVRTSWLFGWAANFLRTMLALGAERDEVAVVDDQRGSRPSWGIWRRRCASSSSCRAACGTSPPTATARGRSSPRRSSRRQDSTAACAASRRGARPSRAAAGVLGAAQRARGAPLPHWRDGLRDCLARL